MVIRSFFCWLACRGSKIALEVAKGLAFCHRWVLALVNLTLRSAVHHSGQPLPALADDPLSARRCSASWHKTRGLSCIPCSMKTTHFDLKSMNVLLTKSGTAKLADVGLARYWPAWQLSRGYIT